MLFERFGAWAAPFVLVASCSSKEEEVVVVGLECGNGVDVTIAYSTTSAFLPRVVCKVLLGCSASCDCSMWWR